LAAVTFPIAFRPRGIHQNAAHHPRRHRDEMHAILPLDLGDLNQPEIRLVDQGGCLQRMVATFVTHVPARDAVQLLVDERQQAVECVLFTSTPRQQQGRRFV
jgi:hypothetical protein